jgi:lysophospholipase L1-like esterase
MRGFLNICFLIFANVVSVFSQENYEKNDGLYFKCSASNTIQYAHYLSSWCQNIKNLLAYDSGVVSVVHIGDSHIQADYLTGETRRLMQNSFGNAGRGFVFPYQIANSNGSYDIVVDHEGSWQYCKVLKPSDSCYAGLSGIKLVCQSPDSRISFDFKSKNDRNYFYNKFLLFHDSESPHFIIENSIHSIRFENVTEYYFTHYQSELHLIAGDSLPRQIMGFSFENSKPGLLYHSMGINGANTSHLSRNDAFGLHLAGLQPNLVILSFGTNDAYVPEKNFNSQKVKARYRSIINQIREANPQASILITTPPDHFFKKKMPNPNQREIVKIIYEIASESKVAIWDLYTIMGGKNAIVNWAQLGYARGDYIHFTKEGYLLQGRLLHEALMQVFEDFLENPITN